MALQVFERRIAVDNGLHQLATTFYVPENLHNSWQAVLFFFPGAGYTRGYFDIAADGVEGHSQCRYHATHGFLCVAVDHLGVGESSLPEDGLLLGQSSPSNGSDSLSIDRLACCTAELVSAVLRELSTGNLSDTIPVLPSTRAVGIGHSMGGHVVVKAQADHECFDALVLLGASFTQTRLALAPGKRYPFRSAPREVQLQAAQRDSDLEASFYWPKDPPALVALDRETSRLAPWRSPTVPRASVNLLEPAVLAYEAARIRVPVLLAFGEVDVTPEPLDDLRMFRSSTDLALLIIPQMAHLHNFARTRRRLWHRIERFAGDPAEVE